MSTICKNCNNIIHKSYWNYNQYITGIGYPICLICKHCMDCGNYCNCICIRCSKCLTLFDECKCIKEHEIKNLINNFEAFHINK